MVFLLSDRNVGRALISIALLSVVVMTAAQGGSGFENGTAGDHASSNSWAKSTSVTESPTMVVSQEGCSPGEFSLILMLLLRAGASCCLGSMLLDSGIHGNLGRLYLVIRKYPRLSVQVPLHGAGTDRDMLLAAQVHDSCLCRLRHQGKLPHRYNATKQLPDHPYETARQRCHTPSVQLATTG
jgi:hypothetical protein